MCMRKTLIALSLLLSACAATADAPPQSPPRPEEAQPKVVQVPATGPAPVDSKGGEAAAPEPSLSEGPVVAAESFPPKESELRRAASDEPKQPRPEESLSRSLEALRQAADLHRGGHTEQRALVGALIGRGDAASLAEAEALLAAMEAKGGFNPQWMRLMRAALAAAGGENLELAGLARASWLDALAALPPEVGRVLASSGERRADGSFGERGSVAYQPDDYVALAFEAKCLGVTENAGRFAYDFKVDARLLDSKGIEVESFRPPAFSYRGQLDYPADRFSWFEFVLQQRLPRELAPGIYTVEIGLTDAQSKGVWGRVTAKLEIHVR